MRAGDGSGVRVLADADEEPALRRADQHVAGEHEAGAAEHFLLSHRQAVERRPEPADHGIVRQARPSDPCDLQVTGRKHRIWRLARCK